MNQLRLALLLATVISFIQTAQGRLGHSGSNNKGDHKRQAVKQQVDKANADALFKHILDAPEFPPASDKQRLRRNGGDHDTSESAPEEDEDLELRIQPYPDPIIKESEKVGSDIEDSEPVPSLRRNGGDQDMSEPVRKEDEDLELRIQPYPDPINEESSEEEDSDIVDFEPLPSLINDIELTAIHGSGSKGEDEEFFITLPLFGEDPEDLGDEEEQYEILPIELNEVDLVPSDYGLEESVTGSDNDAAFNTIPYHDEAQVVGGEQPNSSKSTEEKDAENKELEATKDDLLKMILDTP